MSERIPSLEHIDELGLFKKEIEERRQRDMERGIPIHLFEVQTDELTEEDYAIWKKVKDETITIADYREYRDNMKKSGASKSRIGFAGFVANIASGIITNRQLEERVSNKNK